MKIENIRMVRTVGALGEMVGCLSWDEDGKGREIQVGCGEEEEDLLEALEACLQAMLADVTAQMAAKDAVIAELNARLIDRTAAYENATGNSAG